MAPVIIRRSNRKLPDKIGWNRGFFSCSFFFAVARLKGRVGLEQLEVLMGGAGEGVVQWADGPRNVKFMLKFHFSCYFFFFFSTNLM